MKLHVVFFIVIVQTARLSSSARILAAVPSPQYSHHAFYRPLWKELAKRGHEVVLLTSSPFKDNFTNLNEVDMSFRLGHKAKAIITTNYIQQANKFYNLALVYSDMQLGHSRVQSLLQNDTEHFDLVMVEYLVPPFFALKERFKCPMILLSSMDFVEEYHGIVGNPSHELMYSYLKVIKQEMDFIDRFYAFVYKLEETLFLRNYLVDFDKIVQKRFGIEYPPLQKIIEEVDMCFINTNVVLHPPRPLTPATINIGGGMHMDRKGDPNNLPQDLKQFLDESVDGVIYFNLGSNVNTNDLSIETKNKLLAMFADIKYDVLWKFKDNGLSDISSNVKMVEWVSQLDVFGHKNVKLFMTQGGVHSIEEALVSRKPMIVFPFLADQHGNAMRVQELGLGLHLNLFASTSKELKAAIADVIENPKYKQQVVKYGKIMEDMPMKPLERAVWWTEYVLRHKGGKHLRGKTLPFWSYYYLDVIAFIVIVLATLSVGFCALTKRIYLIYNLKSTRSKEQSKCL